MSLATDREEDLVHMPFVSTTRATTTEFIGGGLPKRANTIAGRFHRSRQSRAARRPLFDITKTERETEIQPHRVAHDFRREAETFVIGSNAVCFHEAILTYCSALLPS
jgi:hypothetical protein